MTRIKLDSKRYYQMLVTNVYDPTRVLNEHHQNIIRRVILQTPRYSTNKTPAKYVQVDGVLFEEVRRIAESRGVSMRNVVHALVALFLVDENFREELLRGAKYQRRVRDRYVELTRAVMDDEVTQSLEHIFKRAVAEVDKRYGVRSMRKDKKEFVKAVK